MPRKVVLTDHAVDQAQMKFIELAPMEWYDLRRRLTAAAGHAKVSEYDHVCVDQGFLDGALWLDDHDARVSFAYKRVDDTFVIMTTLTREEVAGHGASVQKETHNEQAHHLLTR